jgi:hypothetical protein
VGSCYSCRNTILFGGIKDQGYRFCSKACLQRRAPYLKELSAVSDASANTEAERIKAGRCSKCGRNGSVDFHKSIFVWSAIIITRTSENKFICCSVCARKKQALDTLGTATLGWWGIPFGLIMTPMGILINVAQMIISAPKPQPSKQLIQYAREGLARAVARS